MLLYSRRTATYQYMEVPKLGIDMTHTNLHMAIWVLGDYGYGVLCPDTRDLKKPLVLIPVEHELRDNSLPTRGYP